MTPRTPQVGDTITTAEELDALPRGAVVIDAFGKACQRLADDGDVLRWWRCGHHLPNRAHLPANVLHLDESPHPPRPEREVKAEALREAADGVIGATSIPLADAHRAACWLLAEADRIARGDH